jgi:hypothetical protein
MFRFVTYAERADVDLERLHAYCREGRSPTLNGRSRKLERNDSFGVRRPFYHGAGSELSGAALLRKCKAPVEGEASTRPMPNRNLDRA